VDDGARIVGEDVVAHGVLPGGEHGDRSDLLERPPLGGIDLAPDEDPLRVGRDEGAHDLTIQHRRTNDVHVQEPCDIALHGALRVVRDDGEPVPHAKVDPQVGASTH